MNQWLVRQNILLDLKSTNLLMWRTVWQEPTRWLEVDHSKTDGRTQIGCALSSWWMQLFSLRLFPSLSTLILSLMTTGTLYLHSEQMLSGCVRVFLTKRVSIRDSSPRAFTWRGCICATLPPQRHGSALVMQKRRNTVLLVGTSYFQLFIFNFVLLQTTSNRFRHTV